MSTNAFELIARHLEHLGSLGRRPSTLRGVDFELKAFARFLGGDLRCPNEESLWEYLSQKQHKPGTRLAKYHILKTFYGWMEEESLILGNPMIKVHPPRQPKSLPTRVMSEGETKILLETVEREASDRFKIRDPLICELMYTCSLRRGEVCALNIRDYLPALQALSVQASHSKNRVGRIVPVGDRAVTLLERYLEERKEAGPDDPLFISQHGARLLPGRLSEIVVRARKLSGIKTKASTHSFRKSSATHMLKNGARLESVQGLLGHTDIASTQVYTKVYPRDIIKMHRAHHPREKQKNIVLPELKVPKKKIADHSHKRGRDSKGRYA